MIGVGSLVRFNGTDKRFWNGKLLSVHERKGDKIVVWNEQKPNGKWTTAVLDIKDVEEVR